MASGRFSAERHFLSVSLPLAWHPRNRNALVVLDLQADPAPLLELSAEQLRQRLYTRRDELAEGELPVPLKLLHINRCPVVAPLNVLREGDRQRLGVDLELCQRRAALLVEEAPLWQPKLPILYAEEAFTAVDDPEQQLYDGFLGDRDRRLCEQVRRADPQRLGLENWPFDDPRLPELLFRYRARNFPETLSEVDRSRWVEFCRNRLKSPEFGAPNTLESFFQALEEFQSKAEPAQQAVLLEWRRYATELRTRYQL